MRRPLRITALFSLFLITIGTVNSQSLTEKEHDLKGFLLENTAWIHFYQSLMTDSLFFQLGVKDDTIVDGTTYHKLIDCTHLGFPIEGECFGGIRKDDAGRCYFLPFIANHPAPWPLHLICEESGTNTEYLLYDFSLSECDVFPYNGDEYLADFPESVFEIEDIIINGSTKKTLWFDDNCGEGEHYRSHNWIEDIGSNQGLLYSIQRIPLNGSQYHLVAILQDGETVYTDPEFEGVTYSIQEIRQEPVLLYPNPIREIGILDISRTNEVQNLLIMTLDGRVVKKEQIRGLSSVIIKKEDIGVGVFIYLLLEKDNNIIVGKFSIID